METTMQLLDKALAIEAAPYWHRELKLHRNAISNARQLGHVSPPIAGAMAKLLGEPIEKWICIAALESAKDSACKEMLIREAGKSWLKNAAKS